MKLILFAACVALSMVLAPALASAQVVRAWVGTVSIPTYPLGPADPAPAFPLTTRDPVYPYTMLDDLTHHRMPMTYQAIYLENKYLKITVLPQLGGHVYAVYDKIDHRNVLYSDPVIKYGLIGPRGAWVSTGMEFNFPFSHSTDTVSPVEYQVVHGADGSATMYVGALDWVSNMYWDVAITLRPDTARLEERVTLFNSTASDHLYWFWTNTEVPATDDMQYIFPMRKALSDDLFSPPHDWPDWNGVDHAWYKNIRTSHSIFGAYVHRNFFGVYYHKSNYGVVHVTNYRQVRGRKIFTWGTAPSGTIWEKILSDEAVPYNEIQSGPFYTQSLRELMSPRRVEEWVEYWYPVRGLDGGYVQATPQMAINVVYPQGASEALKLAMSPVAEVRDATVTVSDGAECGAQILKRVTGVQLMPLQTAVYAVPMQNVKDEKGKLCVNIQDGGGRTILRWSAAAPIDGNPNLAVEASASVKKHVVVTPDMPVEQLYLHGLYLQKRGDWRDATKTYEQVLKRDPGYVPALLKEAWGAYHAADFSTASALLTRAANRDNGTHSDPAIAYAQGAIDRAAGKLLLAEDAFQDAIHYGNLAPPGSSLEPSLAELGGIAIQRHDYARATSLLQQAVSQNPADALAMTDLAVAQRLQGNQQAAAISSSKAALEMPLLPYALVEQWEDSDKQSNAADWTKVISSDPENYVAVAAWYHSLGQWMSSDDVLNVALRNLPAREISPMIYYYLAANALAEGNPEKAAGYWAKADSLPIQETFPNRLADAAVLEEAIRHNPGDTHAHYAMGNFLFAHARYRDAAKLWQEALAGGFRNAVLLRNLAVYHWKVDHNLQSAADFYRQAIALTPGNYRLYEHLDEVCAELGDASRRAALFANAPKPVLSQDTVRARHAVFLMEQSKPDEALAVLANHTFEPWEGGKVIHEIYVAANVEKGRQALDAGNPGNAANDFRQAMLYPTDLGTGRPPSPPLSEQQYWLGVALQRQGQKAAAASAWSAAASDDTVFSALADRRLNQSSRANRILKEKIQAVGQPSATAQDYLVAARVEEFGGNPGMARTYFENALKIDPTLWQARVASAALRRTARSKEADQAKH